MQVGVCLRAARRQHAMLYRTNVWPVSERFGHFYYSLPRISVN